MVIASASTVVLLLLVEPLDLGLEGVWAALAVLMLGRLTTLTWRYQALDGPLPPLAACQQPEGAAEAGCRQERGAAVGGVPECGGGLDGGAACGSGVGGELEPWVECRQDGVPVQRPRLPGVAAQSTCGLMAVGGGPPPEASVPGSAGLGCPPDGGPDSGGRAQVQGREAFEEELIGADAVVQQQERVDDVRSKLRGLAAIPEPGQKRVSRR
jgi:hypothetical protein